jgi:uncharacterized protein YaaN involved in tellurite resistance
MDSLQLQTKDTIKLDTEAAAQVNPALEKQAGEIVKNVMGIDLRDLREQQRQALAVSQLGASVQKDIQRRSAMLRQPMAKLVNDAEDGGPVAKSLLLLQEKTSEINPNRVDFSMGAVRRALSMLPGVGTPLSRWFAKYQSVDGVIKDVVKNLEDGRAQLERDNVTLRDDQIAMRELTFKLKDFIQLGQILDQKFAAQLADITDPEHQRFIEEEILFPLRQRIMDLQQQLAVNQQGVLTTEVIIRNNRELIRGVSRSLNVTINALNVAATLALALQTQKKVLQGVEAVTRTTEDLIAQTAAQLKTQGTQIHKQAASTQLDINKLKQAFTDVQTAIDDIARFRREALPQMANSILEMDKLSENMNQEIEKMEGGVKAQDALEITILDEKK